MDPKSHWRLSHAWTHVANTPFRKWKTYVHEGGVATPLIAHWPARIRRRGWEHAVGQCCLGLGHDCGCWIMVVGLDHGCVIYAPHRHHHHHRRVGEVGGGVVFFLMVLFWGLAPLGATPRRQCVCCTCWHGRGVCVRRRACPLRRRWGVAVAIVRHAGGESDGEGQLWLRSRWGHVC